MEQKTDTRSPTQDVSSILFWWSRVCRKLLRPLLYIWGTFIVGTVISTIANLNTTAIDTPFSRLYVVHFVLTFPIQVSVGISLFVVLTILIWLGNRQQMVPPAYSLSEQDRRHLLGRLRLYYEDLLTQAMQETIQVDLGLASRPAAVQQSVPLSLGFPNRLLQEQLLPSCTSIVAAYEQAKKELLILGEPGSGKSALLVKLALYLVKQAEEDVVQPLPIVLPLSSWAVKRLPLDVWLAEQIAVHYGILKYSSQALVKANLVLPLLDGLDEMEEVARSACIEVINIYHREHIQPLVVCSRADEYSRAAEGKPLALHMAMLVLPLTHEQIDIHLTKAGKELQVLRRAFKYNSTALRPSGG